MSTIQMFKQMFKIFEARLDTARSFQSREGASAQKTQLHLNRMTRLGPGLCFSPSGVPATVFKTSLAKPA